jgi:hypothetical protein
VVVGRGDRKLVSISARKRGGRRGGRREAGVIGGRRKGSGMGIERGNERGVVGGIEMDIESVIGGVDYLSLKPSSFFFLLLQYSI